MRIDSTLQKLEVYIVTALAVVLVVGISFSLSAPFSPHHYGATEASQTPPVTSPTATQELQPALLDPVLRTLDGVVHHG